MSIQFLNGNKEFPDVSQTDHIDFCSKRVGSADILFFRMKGDSYTHPYRVRLTDEPRQNVRIFKTVSAAAEYYDNLQIEKDHDICDYIVGEFYK